MVHDNRKVLGNYAGNIQPNQFTMMNKCCQHFSENSEFESENLLCSIQRQRSNITKEHKISCALCNESRGFCEPWGNERIIL